MASRPILDLEKRIDEPVPTFVWTIPANVAPNACARIVVEACKYLLFARQIIPLPFDQLKRSIEARADKTQMEQHEQKSNPLLKRKLKSRKTIQRAALDVKFLRLAEHIDALGQLVEDVNVHAVCLILGSGSMNSLKELYWIALPYGYHNEEILARKGNDSDCQHQSRDHCDHQMAAAYARQAVRELATGAQGLCGHSPHASRLLKLNFFAALRTHPDLVGASTSAAAAASLLLRARTGREFVPMTIPRLALVAKPPVFLIMPSMNATDSSPVASSSLSTNPFGLEFDEGPSAATEDESKLSSNLKELHSNLVEAETNGQLQPVRASLSAALTYASAGSESRNQVQISISGAVASMEGVFEAKPTRQKRVGDTLARTSCLSISNRPSSSRGGGLLAWTRNRMGQHQIPPTPLKDSPEATRKSAISSLFQGPETKVNDLDGECNDDTLKPISRQPPTICRSPPRTPKPLHLKRVRTDDIEPEETSIDSDLASAREDREEDLHIVRKAQVKDTNQSPTISTDVSPFSLVWIKAKEWYPSFL